MRAAAVPVAEDAPERTTGSVEQGPARPRSQALGQNGYGRRAVSASGAQRCVRLIPRPRTSRPTDAVRPGADYFHVRRFPLLFTCVGALLLPTAAFTAPLTGVGLLHDVNALRRAHGLAPLRLSAQLTAAAAQHSREMAADGYFAHASFNGQAFWQRIRKWYRPGDRGLWSVGENLLWSSPDVTAVGAIKIWMASPAHRANLLRPRWREVGFAAVHVARAPGAFRRLEVTILTADFGVRN
jgi:hypothetical protein